MLSVDILTEDHRIEGFLHHDLELGSDPIAPAMTLHLPDPQNIPEYGRLITRSSF